MTNAEMTANRFARWATARRKLAAITQHLQAGHTVVLSTYTRATKYDSRHLDHFRATKAGLLIRQGKGWVNADGCAIRVYA